jgi:DNA polymerase-3 subunit chi
VSAAVTAVAFHFGAPDKIAYAVRLLRKAVGTGVRVLVVADLDQ